MFACDAEAVITDYLTHENFHSRKPGIEDKLERLVALVGKITDHHKINLLELVDSRYALENTYTFDPNGQETKW